MASTVRPSKVSTLALKFLWQFLPIGLADIEYESRAEASDRSGDFVTLFVIILSLRRMIGARIMMPFSPFLTKRPSPFHVRKPAT